MTDPALCADGCGARATRERPYADNRGTELVCARHATLEVTR